MDTFNLQRFLEAQNLVFEQVCEELRRGRKRTHWMWFIFPQMSGMGSSEMSVKYAIYSREEAEAYLNHPILGERLRKCTSLVNDIKRGRIEEIFPYPDDLKFKSSMTLFERIAPTALDAHIFKYALDNYFRGVGDELTIARLRE
jgi:uncharacterized protein (DUF1810 family)